MKRELQGTMVIWNYPFKFVSKRFSIRREGYAETDGRLFGRGGLVLFICIHANMQKRIMGPSRPLTITHVRLHQPLKLNLKRCSLRP